MIDTVVILNAIGLRSKNGGKMFLQEHLENVIYPARNMVVTVETRPVTK